MLSWISSLFEEESSQAGSDDTSLANTDQGNPNAQSQSHMDVEAATPPPLERPRLNSKSSSVTLDRTRPSRVSWIPSISSSDSGPGTPKSFSRPSASPVPTPSPEPTTPRSGLLGFPRRLAGQKTSSESLRIQKVHSERLNALPNGKEEKTLSPIEEREHEHSSSDATATIHFPSGSTRRPSMDSFPKTPDSASSHQPFLTRPLNRSISHSSTNTLLSTVSVQAPSIPPIDLRPPFPGGNGYLVPPPPPRKSHFTPPSLPTVAGSPLSHVSVIYEDRGNPSKMSMSSFRTAGSKPHLPQEEDIVDGCGHGHGLGLHHNEDVPTDVHPGDVYRQDEWSEGEGEYRVTYADSDTDSHSDTNTLEYTPTYPEGLYEVDLGRPPARMSWHVDPFNDVNGHILEHHQRLSDQDQSTIERPHSLAFPDFDGASVHTFSTASSTTRVEFAIHSRWLRNGEYPTNHIICSPRKEKGRITAAFVLFWIGFIAPWCWLLGGWCLSKSGEILPDGPYLHVVDQYYPKGKGSKPHTAAQAHIPDPSPGTPGREPNRKRGFVDKLKTYWHRRSIEALPMTMDDVKTWRQSHPPPGTNVQKVDDEYICPWVHRCRVAALVGGSVLLVAVIVTLVVLSAISTP